MAYDTKGLVTALKDKGLDVAEDALTDLVNVLFDWAVVQAAASTNKLDDVAVALDPVLRPVLLSYVDKVDGKVG